MPHTAFAVDRPQWACSLRFSPNGWAKVTHHIVSRPYLLSIQVMAFLSLNPLTARAPFNPGVLVYALPGAVWGYVDLRVRQGLADAQLKRLITLASVVSGVALLVR